MDWEAIRISIEQFTNLGPLEQQWWIFTHGGWALILFIGVPLWLKERLRRKRIEHIEHTKYVLLALDVPKGTEQSPKAVESIFTALAGAHSHGNLIEHYWDGHVQEPFSFEIASLGGYIQFFVRTPEQFRDLVEAAIYAQYPDAEIIESEDYVDRIPSFYDTEEFDLWGTELTFTNKNYFPIRTYPEFEHTASEDFKDPMAGILEILSRVHPDEDVWLQFLVTPIEDEWKEEGLAVVEKMAGVTHAAHKPGVAARMGSGLVETLRVMGHSLIPYNKDEETHTTEKSTTNDKRVTPGQKVIMEAIEKKIAKIGFRVKPRMIYWGRRETFTKGRGVAAVMGAIQQFNTLNLNGFKPSKLVTTKANYFLVKSRITKRQRKVLIAYKRRDPFRGAGPGIILNTEELATVFHFPVATVKAPLVRKTELKKSEPPFALPVFRSQGRVQVDSQVNRGDEPSRKTGGGSPTNLPIIE